MRFSRLIKFDIRNGIIRFWYRYVIVIVFFMLSAVSLWSAGSAFGLNPASFSLGDYYVSAFLGMKEYFYNPRDPFNFPALWMLLFLSVSYLTLNYPYHDLMGSGRHELIESADRSLWWYSKCCWVVISAVLFFAAAIIGMCIVVVASGGSLSISLCPEIVSILDFGEEYIPGPWNISSLIILMPLATISLCLLQLALSLIMKPIFSFAFTVSLLFFSAYFNVPFLLGNYLMVARSNIFIPMGTDFTWGLIISFCFSFLAILLGKKLFRKMDIIGKE